MTVDRTHVAEFFGTFLLVFAGCGAIVINDLSGNALGHVGIALSFGLAVMVVINTLGDVSGAHINPAVTIGFALARRLPWRQVPPYVASQLLGAIAASFVLRLLFLDHGSLGATQPAGPWWQSLVMEIILTFFLMFVIISTAVGAKEKGLLAGITIGATVGMEALFAGPISGASMNPARSLGPALVSGTWADQWIYLVAPVLGAALAVNACRVMRWPGCCEPES